MPGFPEDLAWLLPPTGKEEGRWGRLNSVYVRFVCATMAHKGHEQRTVVPREAALLLAKSSGRKGTGVGEEKGEGRGRKWGRCLICRQHHAVTVSVMSSLEPWVCLDHMRFFSLERKRSEGSKETEIHAVCICA